MLEDIKERKKSEKFNKMVELANTPESKVEKMNFRQKQKYYAAKSKLGRVFYDSSKGTYRKEENK